MAKETAIQRIGTRNLPTLQDLYDDKAITVRKDTNDLNIILNQPPRQEWVKTNKMANNSLYLPIERIEYLLTRLFAKWRVEIKETKLIANAVVCTVRLHYWDVDGEWNWQDGVGAHNLQVNKDCNPTDLAALKATAVMMSAPIAETEAIKDAAHKIGKLFGRDLNRKDSADYNQLSGAFDKVDDNAEIKARIKRIREALELYAGTDKEEIRNNCQAKLKPDNFDEIYAAIIEKKLGIA